MEKEVPKFEDNCNLIKDSNISLILDSYNDIFSDFDPRPDSERALSNDFLEECKRAARDKVSEYGMELRLLMPKNKRDEKKENSIKRRLKLHFIKHYKEKEKEIKKISRGGFYWILIGVVLNIAVVIGLIKFHNDILTTILGVLEIPSWFLIWEGLGKALIETKKKRFDFDFYKKMTDTRVYFASY